MQEFRIIFFLCTEDMIIKAVESFVERYDYVEFEWICQQYRNRIKDPN